MRYWWVNQNRTFQQETEGGYLWSPKRNANGARNPFYEYMREVAPGGLVLSFQGTFIRAIGVAQSYAYESPKPEEFGSAGWNWDAIGWRVDARFQRLIHQIRPAEHMDEIAPVLPKRYSPLLIDGRGLQSVYLTSVPAVLMDVLVAKVGREASLMMDASEIRDLSQEARPDGLVAWEEHLRKQLEGDESISSTVREQVVLARRGQGRFKTNVQTIERQCRITGVNRLEHLRASHILPWRDCATNESRLDGENGLLLTPSIDHKRALKAYAASPRLENPMHKVSYYVPASHLETTKQALFDAGAGRIGAYDHCCWQVMGQGQFRPLSGSQPFVGEQGIVERIDEYRVEMVCSDADVSAVMTALRAAHPYEEPAFDLVQLVDV